MQGNKARTEILRSGDIKRVGGRKNDKQGKVKKLHF